MLQKHKITKFSDGFNIKIYKLTMEKLILIYLRQK